MLLHGPHLTREIWGIDMESVFYTTTRFSTTAYRKQFGFSDRSLHQEETLRGFLHNHSKDATIVCNGSFALDNKTQLLSRGFWISHPVIHIKRNAVSICEYLGTKQTRMQELVAINTPVFRWYSPTNSIPSRRRMLRIFPPPLHNSVLRQTS